MGQATKAGDLRRLYEASYFGKLSILGLIVTMLFLIAIFSLTQGTYVLSVKEVFSALIGKVGGAQQVVVQNIRLPRIVAAILCGWGLSLAGLNIQTLLRNPLGSPSTLGISQGAACGATFAIVFVKANMVFVTAFAFAGALATAFIILALAKLRRLTPEAIILAGVALSSLFAAATVLLQYLATEDELVKVVFWAFGDVARSNWWELSLLAVAVAIITVKMLWLRWDLNAMIAGEETATSLGVNAKDRRTKGMLVAAFVAAVATAFHGVIAFVGLIAPHIARRIVGDDHCLLIYFSAAIGALLLLLADTVGRLFIGSGTLPVGVLTSFLGGPMFLFLLLQGEK